MTVLQSRALVVTLGSRKVLDGIDITCRPREVTAIVGPNGAGKSTLLACLCGLLAPASGAVTLGGDSLLALSARARAKRIGLIPQYPEIAWQLDVHTVVTLGRAAHGNGRSAADRAAVTKALATTDTTAFAKRDVTTLSGGERARVILARALAGDPTWLLADEPFAGLDPRHQLEATEIFRNLAHQEGKGVIVTLHDLSLAARMADHVIVLAEGRVAISGTPEAALAPDILAETYGVRTRLISGEAGPLIEILGRTDR